MLDVRSIVLLVVGLSVGVISSSVMQHYEKYTSSRNNPSMVMKPTAAASKAGRFDEGSQYPYSWKDLDPTQEEVDDKPPAKKHETTIEEINAPLEQSKARIVHGFPAPIYLEYVT